MDAAAARLATSPQTLALVASLPPYDASRALELVAQLRAKGADADLVAAAMTQSRLREAGVAKFGEFAAGMVFSQEGLEQATRLGVAAHHAQRYRAAGVETVADLTCGLGADAMTMASLGLGVLACERDEATATLAQYNLRHWPRARVVMGDAMDLFGAGTPDVGGIFADPARRNARGRRHDPADYSPPLDAVLQLRARWPELGIKVGPAIGHEAVPPEAEAQWVSVDGDVVEAGLWMGSLAHRDGHSALVIAGGSAHVFEADPVPGEHGPLGEYLYEPDGAIIRAGLVGPLGDTLHARLVAPQIAYLTADSLAPSPFAQAYRITESLPFHVKTLAAALKARGVGRLDIKKRGMDITPEQLRPQLKLKGDAHATVVITRVGTDRRALLVEPIGAASAA